MTSSSLAVVIFGDFLFIALAACVFIFACSLLLKRCRKDQLMIRNLTMRVVPAELVTERISDHVQVVDAIVPNAQQHI